MSQQAIDKSNAAFWDMLCGSNMAQALGITGRDPDDLRRFDSHYLAYYPYLQRYVPADFAGAKVLEIGLGYGTLGQLIASRGSDYHGVDIAAGPVQMMRQRLRWLRAPEQVQQASALELPFADGTFDAVYSIGCLHHTGNLPRSVDEVHRVLSPGGRAVVMLYNRHSLRRLRFILARALHGRGSADLDDELRGVYDGHAGGEAPHTDFVSRSEVHRLFADFARVRIDVQNFDGYRFGIRREWFLSNLARIVGLDLYVVADKRR